MRWRRKAQGERLHFAVHRRIHWGRQTRRATPPGDRQKRPASPTTYTESPYIALREPLKHKLDRLSNIGVIQKVDTPTSWILALVVTTKKNGKVRLCIDPKPLNEALHRNHYPLPTIDDVLPLLSKARVFMVLDAKNGFWHIQLDEPSSFCYYLWNTLGTISMALLAVRCIPSSRGVLEED